jgi:acetate kinase
MHDHLRLLQGNRNRDRAGTGADIRTFIIPTNEELMIAKDTQALVEAK